MKVLFYAASENGAALPIMKWAQSIIPSEHFGICRSLHDLESKLRRQSTRCKLAIFHVNAVEEMDHLIFLKHLLDDIRIILIVPDLNKETVQKGHLLYPRFMTDSKIDMNQLTAVIKKNMDYLNIEQLADGCANCRTKTSFTTRKKKR